MLKNKAILHVFLNFYFFPLPLFIFLYLYFTVFGFCISLHFPVALSAPNNGELFSFDQQNMSFEARTEAVRMGCNPSYSFFTWHRILDWGWGHKFLHNTHMGIQFDDIRSDSIRFDSIWINLIGLNETEMEN